MAVAIAARSRLKRTSIPLRLRFVTALIARISPALLSARTSRRQRIASFFLEGTRRFTSKPPPRAARGERMPSVLIVAPRSTRRPSPTHPPIHSASALSDNGLSCGPTARYGAALRSHGRWISSRSRALTVSDKSPQTFVAIRRKAILRPALASHTLGRVFHTGPVVAYAKNREPRPPRPDAGRV
jgi:hypothetical protein